MVSVQKLIQSLVYSFHRLSVNSELAKDGRTALNTHSVSPSEKIKQYQAGQTVTCFLKKVSSAASACDAVLFSEEKEKLETRAISARFDSGFAPMLVYVRQYKASLPENFLV